MANNKQRTNVARFLPHWQDFLKVNGPEATKKQLDSGKYTMMNRKDAYEIKKLLGLTAKEVQDGAAVGT